ncbi:MAG: MFS transporter [Bacilli bacterium]|nr:MFS transporter [Bacilli bacterium]
MAEEKMQSVESSGNAGYISRTSGLKQKDYIGYALGDFAGCLCFATVTTLLQKYYTDILGLSPLFIMIMFIVARVWDAINDPIMGRIVDLRKPNKNGRYRVWMKYVSIPLAVATVLMFLPWTGMANAMGNVGTMVFATITYVAFGMIYTMHQIPYGSLASIVTTDVKERNKLSVFRSVGAALGSVPVLLVTMIWAKSNLLTAGPTVIEYSSSDIASMKEAGTLVTTLQNDYANGNTPALVDGGVLKQLGENGQVLTTVQYLPIIIGVAVSAVIAAVLLFLAYKWNKERVIAVSREEKTKENKQKNGVLAIIKALFKNRSFVGVCLVGMLLLAGQMFTQSFYTYLFNDMFGMNWMNMVSMVCTYLPMAVLMLFAGKLVRKFGKKEICAVGASIAAVSNLALFFLQPVIVKIPFLFLAFCLLSGVGLSIITLEIWAIATDAIDDVEVKTGMRNDGTSYSAFMFFRKFGQVIAAVAVNAALLAMNYRTGAGQVQTAQTLDTMYKMATIIPAVMFGVMALVFFFVYALNHKKTAELQVAKEELLAKQVANNEITIGEEAHQ